MIIKPGKPTPGAPPRRGRPPSSQNENQSLGISSDGAAAPAQEPTPAGSPLSGPQGPSIAELKSQHREEASGRRVHRKKGTEPDVEALEKRERFISGLALFSGMALEFMCSRMPVVKPPTKAELDYWNDGVTAVTSKYFSTVANWDAELSLALAAVVVFAPRLKTNAKANTASSFDIGKVGNGENGAGKIIDGQVLTDSHP